MLTNRPAIEAFLTALDSLEDTTVNDLPKSAWAQRVLQLWWGDYEVRRTNGQYRVTLFEPSREYDAWGARFTTAVLEAARKAARATGGGPAR